MEGCKHTRRAATVDSVGEGGAFRAARTTWTPDRTGGGGGSGIPSLRRRRISLRRQSPTPMPTTHSVAVDNRRYYAHIANAAEVESRRPTLWYGLRRASSLPPLPTRDLHRRTPILAMVRPPVTTKLLLGLYSLFYSCTIALDARRFHKRYTILSEYGEKFLPRIKMKTRDHSRRIINNRGDATENDL
ncbi:hypothetical protein AGLY_017061 [Aphis glycines]|uniref:Uncharacterized protein n=1 Tax=Aphis glycines TaxID=307491 RepID=A0A6G0SVX5_APHGL|nr:hypothetical protein AGLY_017061 [Aphis glycines]